MRPLPWPDGGFGRLSALRRVSGRLLRQLAALALLSLLRSAERGASMVDFDGVVRCARSTDGTAVDVPAVVASRVKRAFDVVAALAVQHPMCRQAQAEWV
jgi:hypothetical protein